MTDPIALLRGKVDAAASLRKYAASINCSPAYISDILNGSRAPGPKVLRALGLDRETQIIYKKKRI